MNIITIHDSIDINITREKLFTFLLTVDTEDIMKGYIFLPSVVGIKNQTGKWNIVGSTRIALLSDGSTTFEEVTQCIETRLFSYKVSQFTNMFRHLIYEARGEWVFKKGPSRNTTSVQWTYSFYTKNFLITLFLLPIMKIFWKRYMRRTLHCIKTLAEK